jgi:cell division protein FtsI/penicillin-binding protein 2
MNSIKRIKIVKWSLSLLFFAFFIYIFLLQTVYSKKYEQMASRQHCDSISLLAERGKIFDTKGTPLAYNQLCASVRILPQYVRCRDSVANLLAIYDLKSKNDIINDLTHNTKLFWFKKYVDYQTANQLKKDLRRRQFDNSIIIADDLKRIYPFGPSLGSVLGILGEDNGLAGVEFACDKILKGKQGCIILQKDAIGNNYYWPTYPMVRPQNGDDVVLTINLDMQEIAYRELAKYVDNFKAIRGSVLVIDTKSGAILTMCDYPDFDPQSYNDYSTSLWTSTAVSDEFEPGSVYKLVICATALESENKEQLLNREYDVSRGFIEISGKKINDVHKNGIISFYDIFTKSSNIGVSMLSQCLSREKFFLMERRFGFSVPTGIELPGEANGYLDPPRFLTPLRFSNNAFGQGVRTTLLQLSIAYLTIADDGLLLKPYIIKEIIHNGKTIYQGKRNVIRRVLDEPIAMLIKDILSQAVIQGTGRAAQLDDFLVCGKTGTAQKLEPDGTYSQKKSIMTFIGFFPKENPQYLISVLVDEPKISRFASEITCPLFHDIGVKILQLQNSKTITNNKDLALH